MPADVCLNEQGIEISLILRVDLTTEKKVICVILFD